MLKRASPKPPTSPVTLTSTSCPLHKQMFSIQATSGVPAGTDLLAMWLQECTLLGKPGQCGEQCATSGQSSRASGFVVCPSFSESDPQQDLSDSVSGAASFLTLRGFLAACNPRNNEVPGPLHHPGASAEKQAAFINRWYLQFPLSCLQGFLE